MGSKMMFEDQNTSLVQAAYSFNSNGPGQSLMTVADAQIQMQQI